MTPTPAAGAGDRMTAHEIEKRVSKEVLETVEELTEDADDGVTTAAVVEAYFGDPEENARHGDPVGWTLADLDAHGYVRREGDGGDGESGGAVEAAADDVWFDARPAAFIRDYVDTDATWPPNRGET